MNLPNKLSILRMILVPVFLVFLLVESVPYHYFIALFVFAAASFTDMLDGKIARKHNLITDFGKFIDPLADKLLVCAALICMIPIGCIPALATFIIVARDSAISGLRSVAASSGKVIAANIFGKIKTVLQMGAVCMSLLFMGIAELSPAFSETAFTISNIVWWVIAAYTLVTMVIYFVQNASSIDTKK